MSDIFLSYASKDRARAKVLAGALERQGWSVWWDRKIPAGKTFTQVITQALADARCVVVVWSHDSIKSNWVLEEAEEGRSRGILVPVLMKDVSPPLGFRSIQAADLSHWDGEEERREFQELLEDIVLIIGSPRNRREPEKSKRREFQEVESLIREADGEYEQLEYEKALVLLNAALQHPRKTKHLIATIQLQRGLCLLGLQRENEAVDAFVECARIKPRFRVPDGVSRPVHDAFDKAFHRLALE